MAATSADPLERLEAALALGTSAPSRRMLIIVNPYATTVSDRLKNLVVYALRGRYEVDAIDTDVARPRDRAVPRGGARGLRRGRRVRRRRHRERGRERTRRVGHAAVLPSRRSCERVLPDARDPDRRRRRHRAPAADGRRLAPRAGRRRLGERTHVPVLRRRRPRRERGRARRRAPAPEGAVRRVVLHVDGRGDVHPALPAPSAAARGAGRRGDDRRRDGDRSELDALHLLRGPARRDGRGRDARPAATSPLWCSNAPGRSTSRRSSGAPCRPPQGQPPPSRASVPRRRTGCASGRGTSGRCRSRSTATTSARSTRQCSA